MSWVYRPGHPDANENGMVAKDKAPPLQGGVFHVMPDLAPFTTQDGVEITSRSHLRRYEQANGVRQVGNDYASEIRAMKEKLGWRV